MSIGTADIHKGILTAWDNAALDLEHTVYWTNDQTSKYQPLQQAGAGSPGTPFPHTMYEEGIPLIVGRMSGDETATRIIKEIPWTFRVRARQYDSQSAKLIATNIASSIMTAFGAHHTSTPEQICLDVGGLLRLQYQYDRSVAEDEETHLVIIEYTLLVDVPVEL